MKKVLFDIERLEATAEIAVVDMLWEDDCDIVGFTDIDLG